MVATFITTPTFSRFSTGYFQVLGQFFSEATAKTLFHVGANRVQASYLLFDQFPTAIVLQQDVRVFPKILEKLAGKLIDAEGFKPVRRIRSIA